MQLQKILFSCPDPSLQKIAEQLAHSEFANTSILGVAEDSRLVGEGECFVAIKGLAFDGHEAIEEVIKKKASVIFFESQQKTKIYKKQGVLFVSVLSTRKALANFYYVLNKTKLSGLNLVGITGTNGKTSVSYLLEFLLAKQKEVPGVMGTIDHHINEKQWETHLTSPNALNLFKRLDDFNQEGMTSLILEVSSHALSQSRLEVFPFNYVVFTNLTQDHLDYHKNFSAYFKAKQKLFLEDRELMQRACKAFINIDDPSGKKLKLASQVELFTYGKNPLADFSFKVLSQNIEVMSISLVFKKTEYIFTLPLIGVHNAYNAVASLAVAYHFGYKLESLTKSLSEFNGIPGRLQKVKNNKNKSIFIDYAHTPGAICSVLSSVRSLSKKVGIVFGCGGDRDKLKRPLMLDMALQFSDFIVLTSDNPRSEDPESIIADVLNKKNPLDYLGKLFVISNRSEAISFAISQQKEGGLLIISGKGHESTQIIGEKIIPWDDYTEAQRFLSNEE